MYFYKLRKSNWSETMWCDIQLTEKSHRDCRIISHFKRSSNDVQLRLSDMWCKQHGREMGDRLSKRWIMNYSNDFKNTTEVKVIIAVAESSTESSVIVVRRTVMIMKCLSDSVRVQDIGKSVSTDHGSYLLAHFFWYHVRVCRSVLFSGTLYSSVAYNCN